MLHRWSRTLSVGCAGLLAASALVACGSDDDGPPSAATPRVTGAPSPSSSPSAAPSFSFTPSAAPTPTATASATFSALPSATPSPVPSPPFVPFRLAAGTTGGIAVGSDGTSWLVAFTSNAGIVATRVGPLGEVLDPTPIVLSASARNRNAEDPAFSGSLVSFSGVATAFDGAAYAVSFTGSRDFSFSTLEGGYEHWIQRVSPAGRRLGQAALIRESRPQFFGEFALREPPAAASGDGEIFTFYRESVCYWRFSPNAPCPLRLTVEAERLIGNGEGYDKSDPIGLRRPPGPLPTSSIVPMSPAAAAWNGDATFAAWSEATVASHLDGGFSEPMITGALLRDGGFERLTVASGGDFAGEIAVGAHRGNFLVVWQSEMRNEIRGRFIDAEGRPNRTGPASAITRGKEGALTLGGVAATEDGFLVIWVNENELRAVRFDAGGVKGGTFVLDPGPVETGAAVAASENGYLVAFARPNRDLIGRYLPSSPR